MRRSLVLGGMSLLIMPLTALAQGSAASQEVAAANAAFDAALSRRDLPAVEALWLQDTSVTVVHPRDHAPAVGWAAVRRSWEETFARFSEFSVVMPDPRIRVTGDTAIVIGLENVRGRRASDGAVVAFDAMTTNVFQGRAGRWLLVHHQATMVPA